MLFNYYYSKLNLLDKTIYKECLEGIKKQKKRVVTSGTPSSNLFQYLSNDHPELFYCDFNHVQYTSTTFGKCEIFFNYLYSRNEIKKIEDNLKEIINSFQYIDEEHFCRIVHNYLVRNTKYDEREKHGYYDSNNHSLIGPLINHVGVCSGISNAFKYILDAKKIDCCLAIGTCGQESHCWNVVNINGYNYHVDVTNDIQEGKDRFKKPLYFYYLVTDKEIQYINRTTENFNCFQTRDNPFYKNNRVFKYNYEIDNFLKSLRFRDRTFYFKYIGSMNPDEVLNYVTYNLPVRLMPGAVWFCHNASNSIYYFRI